MPLIGAGVRNQRNNVKSVKQDNTSRVPKPWRRPNYLKSVNAKYDGSSTAMPDTHIDRHSTIVVRKKLPWLDGGQQSKPVHVPGSLDSKESLTLGDANASPSSVPEKDDTLPMKRTSASSLGQDPALRAVGSTPSMRTRARSGDYKTLSLNSQPRPGIRPVNSKKEAKRALGIVNEGPSAANSASSEYSATPSSERTPMPGTLPKNNPSSYERLVDRRTSTKHESREPFHVANQWLQSQLDLPLDEPSPRDRSNHLGRTHEAQISPRHTGLSPGNYHRSNSCRSCDEGTTLREPPKAKALRRRATAAGPAEPPSSPPPPPPSRKTTLFAMPSHLLPSSSSSSQDHPARVLRDEATSSLVSPPQLPASPPPALNAQDMKRQSQSLNRAVTGLENLMEEALNVAKNAAQSGRNDEVANILHSATFALRKASTVHGQMNTGRMSHPLVLSPAVSERDSTSDSVGPDSDASSVQSTHLSVDTAPTLMTKSAQSSQQPILADQYKPFGRAPTSRKASVRDVHDGERGVSPDRHSMSLNPPRLYQPPSADSIVRDFAYARAKTAKAEAARQLSKSYGAAADYYADKGQSVGTQPGVRPSVRAPMITDKPLPPLPGERRRASVPPVHEVSLPKDRRQNVAVHRLEPVPTNAIPPRVSSRSYEKLPDTETTARQRRPRQHHHHLSNFFESSYYHQHPGQDRALPAPDDGLQRTSSSVTDARYDPSNEKNEGSVSKHNPRYSGPTTLLQRDISLRHPRRKHISLKEGQGFSLGRYHKRQPIAREWSIHRKRIAATIACMNTVFIGLIAGIYAGEVPRIQYQLADTSHKVILGNVVLFACLGVTTIIFWPLPLLHGRKPYTLMAYALMLPLMFPQALAISGYRNPYNPLYRCGLLIPRAFQGIAMGFANINFLPTLFDLFGASLMSDKPHQEIVDYDDVRRQGGGISVWLGIWSFCFVGSMSIGFCVGAVIISGLDPAWGFYIVVILLAFFLLVNVIAPETRRAPYRRSIAQFFDEDEKLKRRVARGEVKLHISNDGPKWWFQEVWAGIILTSRMMLQPGFFVLALYLAWMYAQVTLVILLLGALLSRDYQWQPHYVGLAVLSVAIGAFLAIPLSKANLFSRARERPQRTDSMTMRHSAGRHISWSSHMLRRCLFTLTLPFAALAYTLSSPGPSVSWTTPTIFCGLVGFLSNLAIAECVGLIMEAFDTCDLQPGVNQKHRLQSMQETTRRRRTNYSSFPRICAGFFAAQGLGFILSAAATGVSGDITRAVGAQTATAIVASILLGLTVLFIIALWRWKAVQVIPNNAFGSGGKKAGSIVWGPGADDPEWKPVIIGNPSGKMRRMNLLELGSLTRWTEIRRLNKLVRN